MSIERARGQVEENIPSDLLSDLSKLSSSSIQKFHLQRMLGGRFGADKLRVIIRDGSNGACERAEEF